MVRRPRGSYIEHPFHPLPSPGLATPENRSTYLTPSSTCKKVCVFFLYFTESVPWLTSPHNYHTTLSRNRTSVWIKYLYANGLYISDQSVINRGVHLVGVQPAALNQLSLSSSRKISTKYQNVRVAKSPCLRETNLPGS